jgi:hypothetical protein
LPFIGIQVDRSAGEARRAQGRAHISGDRPTRPRARDHRISTALRHISYIDASFWDFTTEFVVEFDPAIYLIAKARATKMLTTTAASELPPEGWIAGGHECERCPFTKACGIERQAVPAPSATIVDPQLVAEIRDLAIAYKARQGDADAATTKLREVQHEIRERLRAKGLRRVAGDDFSVTWSPVKGRQGFDVKALSAAATAVGIDVTEFETVGDPGDRLDIRVREARTQ